ncbi:hypothetical protein ANN_26741 [Periplaneta americana]|uniref:Uncharacterized protein n=1 Tax=Periplaneta americana TaxID=6978 RepID=A0ABQ8RYW7_PERAM|nr:hypothetical protein ANN_26741 [Periplaneta americana]
MVTLLRYPHAAIAKSIKLHLHLWYLYEEVIVSGLFDSRVPYEMKKLMVAIMEHLLKRPRVNSHMFLGNRGIEQFFTENLRTLFKLLGISEVFLSKDPSKWKDDESYNKALKIVQELALVNDRAGEFRHPVSEIELSAAFCYELQASGKSRPQRIPTSFDVPTSDVSLPKANQTIGHVARMGESRNGYRVLVGRPEGKRPLGRPRRRWEDNIKMDLREVGYDDRDWINLAQDRDLWRAYVRAAMNLRSEVCPDKSKDQHHVLAIAFDYMQNISLPVIPVQGTFYLRQLNVNSFCIHDVKKNHATLYIYNEGIAKKGPNECTYDGDTAVKGTIFTRSHIDGLLVNTYKLLYNSDPRPSFPVRLAYETGKIDTPLKRIRRRQVPKKLDMEKLKNEEERRKFEEHFEEKTAELEFTP